MSGGMEATPTGQGSSPLPAHGYPPAQPFPTTPPPPVGYPTYPPPVPGSPAPPQTSASGRYRLRLSKVTSFLIMTQRRTVTLTGTFEELEAAYNKARTHNLLAGWWGIPFGLIWTPIVLSRNAHAFKQLRQLAGR